MSKKKLIKLFKNLSSRLSMFDYLSFILIGCAIIFFILFFGRKVEWLEIEARVAPSDFFWSEKEPPFWLANSVHIGENETDSFGRKVVEILDAKVFESSGNKKDVFVKLKLQAVKDPRKNQYLFKNKPLSIGAPIELNLSQVFLAGVVTYIKGVPDTRIVEDKIIEARIIDVSDKFPETIGIYPWRSEAIQVGDKVKDTQERVVAEIIEKRVELADKTVITSDGRVLVAKDPLKRDVTLIIRLKTYNQDGINYFLDDYKVKVGSLIFLSLPKIDLWPEITKIIR